MISCRLHASRQQATTFPDQARDIVDANRFGHCFYMLSGQAVGYRSCTRSSEYQTSDNKRMVVLKSASGGHNMKFRCAGAVSIIRVFFTL